MPSKDFILRIARPSDNLEAVSRMYKKGLGFEKLGAFKDHNGFDGIILGHKQCRYHLEFTHHRGTIVGKAPTHDNLLVFYIPDEQQWKTACRQMITAGFVLVKSYNMYWDETGKTFEDLDGYRVVLQNDDWSK
jgi:hypothetical protein